MNKIAAAALLEQTASALVEIHSSLDQTQIPCECCGTKVRSDVVEYYAAIAIEGAMSRIRKAASNLRQAPCKDNETQAPGESSEAEAADILPDSQ